MNNRTHPFFPLIIAALLLSGCKTAYYSSMEKLGYEKRDILVDRVEDGRDAQEDARDQMLSALDQFRTVVEFEGGNIQKQYDKLSRELERSEARADEVYERIDAIQDVAKLLFKEWESELDDYSSDAYRRDSERQLKETKVRYNSLMSSMQNAADSMKPVLTAFNDQVLYLKHHLNSQAIAGIQGEAAKIQTDVQDLIEEMEASIAEANAFIDSMDK